MKLSLVIPCYNEEKTLVSLFEQQVLLFPVLVTLSAALTFLFGGSCGAWQWWCPFALVLAYPFLIHPRKVGLVSDGLFFALNLLLFVAISFYTDTYWNCDYPDYHLPATRLLIEGWNPVYDHDLTDILGKLGLERWDMRYSHVAFCQKAVWIFNAVAYKFHHQAFAVSWALNPLLLLGAFFAMFRYCREQGWNWSLAVLLLVVTVFSATFGTPVDDVSCYAAAGLLCTMASSYLRGKMDFLQLAVFSYWMMNAKSVGLLSCFVFWVVFSIAFCLKCRAQLSLTFGRLGAIGGVLVMLLIVTSASPLVTSAIHYGHPLYPQVTAHPNEYPAQDLAWTFRVCGNEEIRMDAPSSFLKSYVSPAAAKAYRRLTGIGAGPINAGLPLWAKIKIWAALATLLALRRTRLTGVQFLLGLVLFPWEGMGMLRYMPWVGVMIALALVSAIGILLPKKMGTAVALSIAILLAAVSLPELILADIYGFGETERDGRNISREVYAYSFDLNPPTDAQNEEWVRRYSFIPRQCLIGHSTINNIKLLFRERYGIEPKVVPTPIAYVKCDKTFYRGGYCRLPTREVVARSDFEKARIALQKLLPAMGVCFRDIAFRARRLF